MSNPTNFEHKLPFRLDTEALALSIYCVLDFNYKLVQEFETIEDAQEFIAKANRITVDEVKSAAESQSRMLYVYRKNLLNSLKEKALKDEKQKQIETATKKPTLSNNRKPTSPTSSGWIWDDLPDEIKQRFPTPAQRQNYSSLEDFEEASAHWKSRIGRNIGLVLQQHRHSQSKKTGGFSPGVKLLAAWLGFISITLLLTYLAIYLEDIGIRDSVITVTGIAIAWLLILGFLAMYCINLAGEKLPLFRNPEASLLHNILSLVVFLIIASPVLIVAIASVGWILNRGG